ncbi:MAG: type II toxin-antitoxin system RelE/ParE family toxin [Rhizomicrobium sp.]
MRRTAVVSGDALEDMAEIHAYIAAENSTDVADKIIDGFETRIAALEELAERGNFPKELLAIDVKDYRELHFKPYRIVYRVEEKRVVIYCVLDGRRDLTSLLRRRLGL